MKLESTAEQPNPEIKQKEVSLKETDRARESIFKSKQSDAMRPTLVEEIDEKDFKRIDSIKATNVNLKNTNPDEIVLVLIL